MASGRPRRPVPSRLYHGAAPPGPARIAIDRQELRAYDVPAGVSGYLPHHVVSLVCSDRDPPGPGGPIGVPEEDALRRSEKAGP